LYDLFLQPAKNSAGTAGHSFRPPADSGDRPQPNPKENRSPYPGINIGRGSELLDFRFDDTEMLQ
jgi:hypothetical protein